MEHVSWNTPGEAGAILWAVLDCRDLGRKMHKPKTEVNLKQVSISLQTKEAGIDNSGIWFIR